MEKRPKPELNKSRMRSWRFYAGTEVLDLGKRKNGKPWRTLVNVVYVIHGKSDMERLRKLKPYLRFIEET